MMKKQTKFLIFIVLLFILLAGVVQYFFLRKIDLNKSNFQTRNVAELKEDASIPVTAKTSENVTVDFGNGQKLTAEVSTQSAYQALVELAQKNNLSVEMKQYTYGVMVTRIGDAASSTSTGWLYWVNGKPGQIAADRYLINPGDEVEWKFAKY